MLRASQFNGDIYLAETHCEAEQGRLIIANSARSLAAVYVEMAARWPDLSIKKVSRGRIIDLPPSYHEAFQERFLRRKVDYFRVGINAKVAFYYDKTGVMLPGTQKCRCFKENDRYANFLSCIGMDDSDYNCRHCHDMGFTLVDRDWRSWFKRQNEGAIVPKGNMEYDSFQVILTEGGHHCRGTVMTGCADLSECNPDGVLGFFFGSEVEIPKEIVQATADIRNNAIERARLRNEAHNRITNEKTDKCLQEIRSVFGYSSDEFTHIEERYYQSGK